MAEKSANIAIDPELVARAKELGKFTRRRVDYSAYSKVERAAWFIQTVHDMRPEWPLTVRGWYYRAVAAGLVDNCKKAYDGVSDMLASLRRCGLVPWRSVEDSLRTISTWSLGHDGPSEYVEELLDDAFDPRYYFRNLVGDQDSHVIVTVEKDAVFRSIQQVTDELYVVSACTRGRPSATLIKELSEYIRRRQKEFEEVVIFHAGDLDPTGIAIPKGIQWDLLKYHGVDVEVRTIALLPEHIDEYDLPESFAAAKERDSNIDAWIAEYGEDAKAYEIDALLPEDLRTIVREALEDTFDMERVQAMRELVVREKQQITDMRDEVMETIVRRMDEVRVRANGSDANGSDANGSDANGSDAE